MKRLIVFYDSTIKDKGRDSYLKAIKKHISQDKLVINDVTRELCKKHDGEMILVVKPISETFDYIMSEYLVDNPKYDIEGAYTGKLTITAEAIIRKIKEYYTDLTKLKVLIINKSKTVGQPLCKELETIGAKALALDSKADIKKSLQHFKPNVVVTATGNKDFKVPGHLLADTELIIDLSHDTNLDRTIRSIPTVEVLRERLNGQNN